MGRAELERAGAHVTFGVQGLKTHAKLALVVRKEASGLRSYVHIGTGNYHVRTARLYADLGLFTCNPRITQDVVNLFHYLTGHSHAPAITELLVAPTTMRSRWLELIQREIANKRAHLPARIVAKMNQVEDPELIEALCEASAGRGAHRSDRPRILLPSSGRPRPHGEHSRSVHYWTLSRALPHFLFRRGLRRSDARASSLSDRLTGCSAICRSAWKWSRRCWPPNRRKKPGKILDICLRDRRQAWTLGESGGYSQLHGNGETVGTHEALMQLARRRSEYRLSE